MCMIDSGGMSTTRGGGSTTRDGGTQPYLNTNYFLLFKLFYFLFKNAFEEMRIMNAAFHSFHADLVAFALIVTSSRTITEQFRRAQTRTFFSGEKKCPGK